MCSGKDRYNCYPSPLNLRKFRGRQKQRFRRHYNTALPQAPCVRVFVCKKRCGSYAALFNTFCLQKRLKSLKMCQKPALLKSTCEPAWFFGLQLRKRYSHGAEMDAFPSVGPAPRSIKGSERCPCDSRCRKCAFKPAPVAKTLATSQLKNARLARPNESALFSTGLMSEFLRALYTAE